MTTRTAWPGNRGSTQRVEEEGRAVVVPGPRHWVRRKMATSSSAFTVEWEEAVSSSENWSSHVSVAHPDAKSLSKGKRGKVRAVFFDMDDTLVPTQQADRTAHEAVQVAVAQRMRHLDTEALIQMFLEYFNYQAWDPDHQVEVTEWRSRMWAKALAAQGVEDMEFARELQDCFDTHRMMAFKWAAGVEPTVRDLVSKGIKVGIITNGHEKVQRRKLEACEASSLFSTILVGGEEPQQKPHRDIFLKACKLAGCQAEESIMVGDSLQADILGGINAGFLATVWVKGDRRVELDAGSPEPDFTISSVAELPVVLRDLGVDRA